MGDHGATRLRFFLHRDSELAGSVLRVALRVVERTLRECCPGAPPTARFGGITFIHRFGSTLNPNTQDHLISIVRRACASAFTRIGDQEIPSTFLATSPCEPERQDYAVYD